MSTWGLTITVTRSNGNHWSRGNFNSEVDISTPGFGSFTCTPIVRSRFLIFPQNVKLTDISQVCYFDTTTFTWHNPSIEPPLPSGECFSWMRHFLNLLEKPDEVMIQLDDDYGLQNQLTFMMKLIWTWKYPMSDTADDTLNCSGRRSHSAINLNGKLLIFGGYNGWVEVTFPLNMWWFLFNFQEDERA